jgi:surface antigen
MKNFKIIFISLFTFLYSCTGNIETISETHGKFVDFPKIITLGENRMWSATGMLWNGIQYLRFSLNDEEKKMHQSAVYHSLNNSNNGEITYWYSKERLASGKVRVVHSFPISGGHCRVYQSLITLNGATRHFTNNACRGLSFRDGGSLYNWTFLY